MRSVLSCVLALATSFALAGCTDDCDRRCEIELTCAGVDDPQTLEECALRCEREVAKTRSVEALNACVDCYQEELEAGGCGALFPGEGQAGTCFEACRD